jgi:hypothetical protein
MNKRFWMAFVACYVASQVLGFLIHGFWLSDTYKSLATVWRPEVEMNSMMWIMLLTSAVLVFAFCYIFTRGYESKGLMEGVRYGLWVALLCAIPQSLDSFVIYPIPLSLSVKWAVSGAAYFVILGVIVAAIYKREPVAG